MKKEIILTEEMYERLKESLFRISIKHFRMLVHMETDSNLSKSQLAGFLVDYIEMASIKIANLRNSIND